MTDVAEKQHEMNPDYLQVGDPVKDSPVGPGVVTGITEAGYPQVNDQAVAVLIREDGAVFNPLCLDMDEVVAQWREIDKKKAERG